MSAPRNIPYLGMQPPLLAVLQGHTPMTLDEGDVVLKRILKQGFEEGLKEIKGHLVTDIQDVVSEELQKFQEKANNEKTNDPAPLTYKEFSDACSNFKLATEELSDAHKSDIKDLRKKVQQLIEHFMALHRNQVDEEDEREIIERTKAEKVLEDLADLENQLINGNKEMLDDQLLKVQSLYVELKGKIMSFKQNETQSDLKARYVHKRKVGLASESDLSDEENDKLYLKSRGLPNFAAEEDDLFVFPDKVKKQPVATKAKTSKRPRQGNKGAKTESKPRK